jgi:hypothetical protein
MRTFFRHPIWNGEDLAAGEFVLLPYSENLKNSPAQRTKRWSKNNSVSEDQQISENITCLQLLYPKSPIACIEILLHCKSLVDGRICSFGKEKDCFCSLHLS